MKRVWHALAMTFWIYVVITVLAVVPTVAGMSTLSLPTGADYAGGAAAVEAFEEAGGGLAVATLVTVLLAAVLWVLSPLLNMAWLASLDEPRSVAQALGLGASRYVRAVLVSIVMLIPLALAGALLIGAPIGAHFAMADDPNVRTHDLVVLASLLPGVVALAFWAAWHDLSRASLAHAGGGAWRAVREGWRQLGLRAVGSYLGWYFLAALLVPVGHVLELWLDAEILWQAVVLLAAGQLLVLLRLVCRGMWLASALDRVSGPRMGATAPVPSGRPSARPVIPSAPPPARPPPPPPPPPRPAPLPGR